MVFKRVFMPILVLGILFAVSSVAYAQTPRISCALLTATTAAGIAGPALPGPTGAATATGHAEPIAAGTDGTAGAVAGGGAMRVICTNTVANVVGPASVAPDAPTSLALAQLSLGVTITNSTAFPTGAAIRIANATGAFTGFVNTAIGSATGGTVTVNIGTGGTAPTFGSSAGGCVSPGTGGTCNYGSFDILGVLVSFNGSGKTRLDASLSMTGGAGYTVDSANATKEVVTAVSAGVKDPTIPASLPTVVAASLGVNGVPTLAAPGSGPAGGAASFNLSAGGTGVKQSFALRIEENYVSLFKNNTQFNGGGAGSFPVSNSSDTVVQLQFNGVPAGVTISGCAATLSNQAGDTITGGTPTLSSSSITNGSPIMTVNFNGAVDQANVDVLWVACNGVTAPAGTALPAAPTTVQVTLSPAGSALGAANAINTSTTSGQIPRYQLTLQPATALPIVTFPPAAISLLIPFATVGGGYNTGIAISNTTTDPLASGGASVATAQSGTITFTLYDNSGTVKTYTTAASSPGGGLASGTLASGKTYVVNLSELLTAAGVTTGTFTGYVFVQTNFTNAHGAAYVYNGAGFTSATPVLVVDFPSSRPTPEGLGQ